MKRTKEAYFRDHPTWMDMETISGCREFGGEDLQHDSRKQFFKNKQKQWLDEQMKEKRDKEHRQKIEQLQYAQQTFQLNRMRGMLEDNFSATKTGIFKDTVVDNKRMDADRKQKERQQKQDRLRYQREQAEFLKARGAKQQFQSNIR